MISLSSCPGGEGFVLVTNSQWFDQSYLFSKASTKKQMTLDLRSFQRAQCLWNDVLDTGQTFPFHIDHPMHFFHVLHNGMRLQVDVFPSPVNHSSKFT